MLKIARLRFIRGAVGLFARKKRSGGARLRSRTDAVRRTHIHGGPSAERTRIYARTREMGREIRRFAASVVHRMRNIRPLYSRNAIFNVEMR